MGYRYMHVIIALFLTAVLVSAADPFTVKIGYVEGNRVVYGNGVMQLSNCDMPEKPQYVTIGLEIGYPRDACTGIIDVYYSYYDFPLGKYTDEELLCMAREGNTCEGKFYLRFGGKGAGSEEMAAWAKFRAVCRKTGEEFTYAMPAKFSYSPHVMEQDVAAKVSAADASVTAARTAIAQCACCGSYSAILSQLESNNSANKAELARCELVTLANKAIMLKQNADVFTESVRIASTKCASNASQQGNGGSAPAASDDEESLIPQKNESKPPATPIASSEQPAGGVCPMGALLLAAAALAFARKG